MISNQADRRPLSGAEISEFKERFASSRRMLEQQDNQAGDQNPAAGQVQTQFYSGSFGADRLTLEEHHETQQLNYWRDISKIVRTESSLNQDGPSARFVETRKVTFPLSGEVVTRSRTVVLSPQGSYVESALS